MPHTFTRFRLSFWRTWIHRVSAAQRIAVTLNNGEGVCVTRSHHIYCSACTSYPYPFKYYPLTLSILQGRYFVWKAETADPDVAPPTVKQALGTDFEAYVQTMAILVGVIIPSTSKNMYVVCVYFWYAYTVLLCKHVMEYDRSLERDPESIKEKWRLAGFYDHYDDMMDQVWVWYM